MRQARGAGEDSAGRGAQAAGRLGVVPARQRAQPPPQTSASAPAQAAGSRLRGAGEGRAHPEEDKGWTVLATTVRPAVRPDAALLQADQEPPATGAPGLRGRKHPAARSPVWREQPDRIAAWARRTGVGWLVDRMLPRQGRLSLRPPARHSPGTTGPTALPTAAGVLALVSQVALGHLGRGEQAGEPPCGLQPHHRRLGAALGLHDAWYTVSSAHNNGRDMQTP
jgi:hypothetical protein